MLVTITNGTANTATREVVIQGRKKVRLTSREAEVLAYLCLRAGRTVARDDLLRDVFDSDNALSRAADRTVSRLRNKIELRPDQPTHLITVQGEGYRFEPLSTQKPSSAPSLPAARPLLVLGDAAIDLRRHQVRRGSTSEGLSSQEAALLECLLDAGGEPVSRDQLLRDAWGYQAGLLTRAVDNAVNRLRTKIEPDAKNPVFLQTVRGVGYRLVTASCFPQGEVALVAGALDGAAQLWLNQPAAMPTILDTVMGLWGQLAQKHDGQLVTVDRDGLVAAFADLGPALAFAVGLQESLLQHPWDEAILGDPLACEQHAGNRLIQRGPRVRMALHAGVPVQRQELGRTVFAGPVMHRLSSLLAMARGGEIIMETRAFAGLQPRVAAQPLGDDLVCVVPPSVAPRLRHEPTLDLVPQVGRNEECHRVVQGLRAGESWVVAGPPGIGKSRLAQAVVEQLSGELATFLVDASPARTVDQLTSLVVGRIPALSSFGTDIATGLSLLGPTLLVLDGADGLGSEISSVVGKLRMDASELVVLVTARDARPTQSLRELRLDLLDQDDTQRLMRLWARAPVPSELVEAVEGIPLAARLVSARLARGEHVTAASIQSALRHSAHQALAMLSEEERAALRVLCALPDTFPPHLATKAVTEDVVEHLIAKSVVLSRGNQLSIFPPARHASTPTRTDVATAGWAIVALAEDCDREMAATGSLAAARTLRGLLQKATELIGDPRLAQSLRRRALAALASVVRDLPWTTALQSTIDDLCDTSELAVIAARYAGHGGHSREAEDRTRALLARNDAVEPRLVLAQALRSTDPTTAEIEALTALSRAEEGGEPKLLIEANLTVGTIVGLYNLDRALPHLLEALSLAREIAGSGGHYREPEILGHIAHLDLRAGRHEAAHTNLERSLQLARMQDDAEQAILALGRLGYLHRARSQPRDALRRYDEALAQARSRSPMRTIANLQSNRALALMELGRPREAELSVRSALRTYRRLGESMLQASATQILGSAQQMGGRLEDAARNYHLALELLDAGEQRGWASVGLSLVAMEKGEGTSACRHLDSARTVFEGGGFQLGSACVDALTPAALVVAGDLGRARVELANARRQVEPSLHEDQVLLGLIETLFDLECGELSTEAAAERLAMLDEDAQEPPIRRTSQAMLHVLRQRIEVRDS